MPYNKSYHKARNWTIGVITLILLGFFGYCAHGATVLQYYGGGTGSSSTPQNGYLLIGNGTSYSQIASSSLGGGSASTTVINNVQGPTFTFSIVGTSSPSSITTSSANLFLNLLQYASGTDINVASNGTINFVNPGYISTSSISIGGISGNVFATNNGIQVSATGTIGIAIPLSNAYGGTATTTAPSDSQFLSANGSTPTWKNFVNGAGITVSSTATSTYFNTVGFDSSVNIAFTGNNTFAGSSTFNGLTHLNGATDVNASIVFNATATFNGYVSSTFLNKAIFTASGTFTNPIGVSTVYVTIMAGGGGGGGSNSQTYGGGGGGAGGCLTDYPVSISGSTTTVVVGLNGNGGVGTTTAATDGQSSSFGNLTVTGGNHGLSSTNSGTGGAAGSPNATAGATQSAGVGGIGGVCGTFGTLGTTAAQANGTSAFGHANGGGGGGATPAPNPRNGGDGAQGMVIIEW